jgi:hypothetical protein
MDTHCVWLLYMHVWRVLAVWGRPVWRACAKSVPEQGCMDGVDISRELALTSQQHFSTTP